NKGPDTSATAVLPQGVTKDTYGVKIGSAWNAANADTIPTLDLWEDFQCPACADMESKSGAKILELAAAGKVRLQWRPTIFLDSNLQAQNTANNKPNSSMQATLAFGCAVDQDAAQAFHSALFAAQPAEGKGYNNADLTAVAQVAGITGQSLTTFTDCLTKKTYESWVNNSFDLFSKEGHSSTPTGILNGTELQAGVLFDPVKLEQAITDATKK
ncbi:MAG: thioredoxin domain-containing protein, partial [Actinomycetes bacterium]